MADYAEMIRRLQRPKGLVDVVLDTDAYNEIDDQFAIAYALRRKDKLNLQALYAAPFLNERSISPADGMEKSYKEMENILSLMNRRDLLDICYRGSGEYLLLAGAR